MTSPFGVIHKGRKKDPYYTKGTSPYVASAARQPARKVKGRLAPANTRLARTLGSFGRKL